MNREKDELIPFQADVDINLFFPGAQRRELLDEVKKTIAEGVPVLSIIGDEGTGKSMLCKMVEKELSDQHICIYLPENLESFDEVVRILAREAGVGDADSAKSIEEIVSAIIENLKEKEQRLVVIFDQAEKMYLAMLERLRKLLDRVNDQENLLQLIFAGRQVLLENLDQLAICDFADAAETHFYLDDLDASETYAYLNHCARQRSRALGKSIFTPEASKKIFNIARGNLKTTNILAANAIQSADSEGSFVVGPRNVNLKDTGLEGVHESILDQILRRKSWLMYGALFLLLCILLLVFFQGEDKNGQMSLHQPDKLPEVTAEKEQSTEALTATSGVSAEQADTRSSEDVVVESKEDESLIVFKNEAEDQSGLQKNNQPATAQQDSNILASAGQTESSGLENHSGIGAGNGKVEKQAQELSSETNTADLTKITTELHDDGTAEPPQPANQVTVSSLSVQEEVNSMFIPQAKKEEGAAVKSPEQIKKQEKKRLIETSKQPLQEQAETSAVLTGTKKSTPNSFQNTDAPKKLFSVAKVKLPESATAGLQKSQQQTLGNTTDIYMQRVAAGKDMLAGKIKGSQTIQVMALTGDQAEKNLRARLSEKQYRQIADNLYILENKNDSTLFVYYGTFGDRKSADQAIDQLPIFLKKNDPYVISILEAQSKITP